MSNLVERLGSVAQKLQGQPNTDCLTVLEAADHITDLQARLDEMPEDVQAMIKEDMEQSDE